MDSHVFDAKVVSWNFFGIDPELFTFLRSSPVANGILKSKAFRRLSDIRFLGAIDYLLRPTGGASKIRRHTRQQHTLGVTRLAMIVCKDCNLKETDSTLLCSAALLHDIGHAPLSHSMEALFKDNFDIDHHKASRRIITGQDRAGLGREINVALKEGKIDVDELLCLIDGNHSDILLNRLFKHPVNIDTIEAIVRCKNYASPLNQMYSPENILADLTKGSSQGMLLDDFWYLKNAIYTVFINGALGVFADKISQDYFKANLSRFRYDDFFRSERAFRSRHLSLFKLFDKAREQLIQNKDAMVSEAGQVAQFAKRHFTIDPDFEVGDARRYIQSKSFSSLSLNRLERSASADLAHLGSLLDYL